MTELKNHKYYFLILAILSGVLLGLSWYKPLIPLIFLGFVPLLEITHCIYLRTYKYPKFTLWIYSLLSFTLWNAIVYWWLWYAVSIIALAAWIANALLMTLPILAFYIIKKTTSNRFGLLVFLICWMSFEYLHLHWDLSWIWLNLGNVFALVPSWVQWYEYTGTFGGTCWILLVNILIYRRLSQQKTNLVLELIIILPIIFSYYLYFSYKEKGKPVEIALVQPNFDCYTEKYTYNARTGENNSGTYIPYAIQVERIMNLSRNILTDKTAFIAFPETTFHLLKNEDEIINYDDVRKLKILQKKYPQVSIIAGIDSYKILKDKIQHSSATRYRKEIGYYEIFNSALFLGNQGKVDIYRKSKFIIAVETTPFANLLESMTIELGGITGNLGKQNFRVAFKNADSLGVAPIICYESVYGKFVTDYVKAGANILLVITNDGWWETTPGHLQHLAYASLRAIETRKPVARAANTGISGFINQRGDLVKKTRYNETIALRDVVLANNKQTFYVKNGDYLAKLAVFLIIFIFLIILLKKAIIKMIHF